MLLDQNKYQKRSTKVNELLDAKNYQKHKLQEKREELDT